MNYEPTSNRLLIGDVLKWGKRTYTVIGYTPRGKVEMRRDTGTIMACWWPYLSSPPKHYEVWRDGERVR